MDTKDDFLKLFLKHERHLFNFILMLVPNYSDAEDLLQETAGTLWSKFDSFEQGTNFMSWAYQISRHKISNYYRTKKKELNIDDDILESLSKAAIHSSLLDEERKSALSVCVRKLKSADQKLLQMRYYGRLSIPKIAENLQQSQHTLYKRMSAVHRLLYACVQKTINAWETQS